MAKLTRDFVGNLFADGQNDLVRYLASRLPNIDDARDITQEAYLRLLRLEKADLIRNPEAYLFRIATNLIYEYWLKGQRDLIYDVGVIDINKVPDPDNLLEVTTGHQQAIGELERILRVLPPLQQRVGY